MFLVFEGIDGCGKSTQAKRLGARLSRSSGQEVLSLREPGGTELGERVRELVLNSRADLDAETELFLFMAARSHLVRSVLRPALERGAIVICDRYLWSSAAYQGAAGKIGARTVLEIGQLATGGLLPDVTILIDVEPSVGFSRVSKPDRMEGKGVEYQARVREGFLALAREQPERSLVIDGAGSVDEVEARVVAALAGRGVLRS